MLVPAEDLDSQIDPLSELLQGLSMDGSTGPSDGGDTGDTGDNTGDSGSTETPSEDELANFVQVSAGDIDDFWTREFPLISNGEAYTPPADVMPRE